MAMYGAWFEMPCQVELLSDTKLISRLVVTLRRLVLKTSSVEAALVQSTRRCVIFLEGQRSTARC